MLVIHPFSKKYVRVIAFTLWVSVIGYGPVPLELRHYCFSARDLSMTDVSSLLAPICKVWCTYCDLPSRLLLSIYYFTMVHDDGVSCSALARGPSDRLGELGTRVAEEELS